MNLSLILLIYFFSNCLFFLIDFESIVLNCSSIFKTQIRTSKVSFLNISDIFCAFSIFNETNFINTYLHIFNYLCISLIVCNILTFFVSVLKNSRVQFNYLVKSKVLFK